MATENGSKMIVQAQELIAMDFNGISVSYFLDSENNPWWPAEPVCLILGYEDPDQVLNRIDEDDKKKYRTIKSHTDIGKSNNRGNHISKWSVNEPGLYDLILGSEKPEARVFKRWITHEVLPSIRKTGKFTLTSHQLTEHFIGKTPIDIDPDNPKFKLEFFQAICEVYGLSYPDDDKHSPACASIIRKYIYGGLPMAVRKELDIVAPIVDKKTGRRKYYLWQMLKLERIGDFLLRRIYDVYAVLNTCRTLGKHWFKILMAQHDKHKPMQAIIDIDDRTSMTITLEYSHQLDLFSQGIVV